MIVQITRWPVAMFRLRVARKVRLNHIRLCAIWLRQMRRIIMRCKIQSRYWQKKSEHVRLPKLRAKQNLMKSNEVEGK